MQALRIAAPSADSGTTAVVEIDDPTPGCDHVAIAVEYAGINFIDVTARRGDANYTTGSPYVPGREARRDRGLRCQVRSLLAGGRLIFAARLVR